MCHMTIRPTAAASGDPLPPLRSNGMRKGRARPRAIAATSGRPTSGGRKVILPAVGSGVWTASTGSGSAPPRARSPRRPRRAVRARGSGPDGSPRPVSGRPDLQTAVRARTTCSAAASRQFRSSSGGRRGSSPAARSRRLTAPASGPAESVATTRARLDGPGGRRPGGYRGCSCPAPGPGWSVRRMAHGNPGGRLEHLYSTLLIGKECKL